MGWSGSGGIGLGTGGGTGSNGGGPGVGSGRIGGSGGVDALNMHLYYPSPEALNHWIVSICARMGNRRR